jgi:Fe-S cluster assembly protein SufD
MSELSTQLAATLPPKSGFGPEWFNELRESGAEKFRTHGLPTRKDEAWKYTGLAKLEKGGVQLASVTKSPSAVVSHPAPLVEAGIYINMFDGRMLPQGGSMPAGLKVLSLSDALESGVSGLQDLLESLPETRSEGSSSDGFTALNTATLDSGVVIHVAAGTDGGRLLLNWSTQAGDTPLMFNTRICVILEPDAKLELLEQFENPNGNANTSNIVLQAELGESSGLQHVRFQQESDAATLITHTEVSQRSGSEYVYFGFDLGGGLVRHDLRSSLLGRDSKAIINGAYLLDGNRHVDNHARVDHISPGGFSDQYSRGVIGGSGKAVFNTAVIVHPGADESEARQSNGNILLSERAVVNTKPELEIYADEVVASHGATVGQLDEQAVFYLRSRGLNEQEARQLLTMAFCRSVSDRLNDPVLGELISQRMMDVMPHAE